MGFAKAMYRGAAFLGEKARARIEGRRGFSRTSASVYAFALGGCTLISAPAQVLDKPKQIIDRYDIQLHGYAAQGFVYTTQNNIFTTRSSDGSLRWSDAVVSVGSVPLPKLRIAAQVRYFRFGKYSDSVSLDWAQADYKFNEHVGVRAGKVKIPNGLFNEIQDIDPAYTWSLLPQSIYAVYNRSAILTENGGILYGSVRAGERFGRLDYHSWLGVQTVAMSNDGSFEQNREQGMYMPDGLRAVVSGVSLRWNTPVPGLMVGASDSKTQSRAGKVTTHAGTPIGVTSVKAFNLPQYSAKYERGKVLAAAEYARVGLVPTLNLTGAPGFVFRLDARNWYGMASYRTTRKLTSGLYYSQQVNHAAMPGPSAYSKDWALSGRYDFNQYLYAKAEQHFIHGTAVGYDTELNPNGLKPNTRLTILKLGFSF